MVTVLESIQRYYRLVRQRGCELKNGRIDLFERCKQRYTDVLEEIVERGICGRGGAKIVLRCIVTFSDWGSCIQTAGLKGIVVCTD